LHSPETDRLFGPTIEQNYRDGWAVVCQVGQAEGKFGSRTNRAGMTINVTGHALRSSACRLNSFSQAAVSSEHVLVEGMTYFSHPF
jgi:hypothetical protein